uniref:SpoU_methylase domain-containing protein n=1 Tax=Steinernema glaseri TaxID=37863 RepID=A0A1I7Y2I5_9BILA
MDMELAGLFDANLSGHSSESKPEEGFATWEDEVEGWIEKFNSSPEASKLFLEVVLEEKNGETLGLMLPSIAEKVDAVKSIREVCYGILKKSTSRVARKAACEAIALLAEKETDQETRLRWGNLVVLLQMLEEPQFHLIKPVLGFIDKLVGECVAAAEETENGADLDVFGWHYGQIAFEKALKHTNGWIRVWTLQKAAHLPVVLFKKDTDFISEHLIPALNGVDNLWRLVEKRNFELDVFLIDFTTLLVNIKTVPLLRSLLRSLTQSWSPVPLYFFSVMLTKFGDFHAFEATDFPEMRRAISGALKIQHLPLKYKTIANLISFFFKATEWDAESIWFVPEMLSSMDYNLADKLLMDVITANKGKLPEVPLSDILRRGKQYFENDTVARLPFFGWVALPFVPAKFEEFEESKELLLSGENEALVMLALYGAEGRFKLNKFSDLDNETSAAFMASYLNTCRTNMVYRSTFESVVKRSILPSELVLHKFVEILSSSEDLDPQFETFLNNSFYSMLSYVDVLREKGIPVVERLKKSLSGDLVDASPETHDLFLSRLRLYDRMLEDEENVIPGLCQLCLDEMYRTSGWEWMKMLFSLISKTINSQVPNINKQISILKSLKSVVGEFQKSIHYLPAIDAFFEVLFTSEARNTDEAVNIFLKFINDASLNPSIAVLLSEFAAVNYKKLSVDWVKPVIELAKFGPIPNHDMKITSAAFEKVFENRVMRDYYATNLDRFHLSTKICRLTGISLAQKMCEELGFPYRQRFLVESLQCVKQIMQLQNRSFGLSVSHREQTRITQLLLLLHEFFPNDGEDVDAELYDYLVNCLLDKCQQYSITLLVEWMIVRICLKFDATYAKFLTLVGELAKKRTGSVTSWLNVVMHVTRTKGTEEEVARFFSIVFPWCSAQNFTIRCTAIAALNVVYHQFKANPWISRFEHIETLLNFNLEPAGNSKRIVEQLTSDFYFKHFDPVADFCLEAVLKTLPQKTGMAEDEQIGRDVIQLAGRLCTTPAFHPKDSIMAIAPSIVYSGLGKSNCCAPSMQQDKKLSEEFVDRDLLSFQRKINVKNGRQVEQTNGDKSLIVVATLIDKAANLGGLARTSEIFGVEKMVVANEAIRESKDFQALSMSAENWLSIEQVSKQDLETYLLKLREEGYKIVAAEQTNNSVSLEVYQFPEKTCILLGDEKEGVSTKLLRLVDQTVEISQIGKTRSLNVHVSASLFIHTYAQQHLIE